uniref:Uncharacterized protein n=2 Tax=Zea mays TaxID=4577 RepID=A0A804QCB8_MAIZE
MSRCWPRPDASIIVSINVVQVGVVKPTTMAFPFSSSAIMVGREGVITSASAKDAEKLNRKLHVDLTSAQARVAALESREAIDVEALKQAKDEHIQKLMEAYLAMDKQEHPESCQDPPPELFESLTMKKIPAPSLEVKEEAASTPPAPPPSEELQEPVQLEEEFDPVLPSQSPPEEVINISSLLTHPGDVSD